MIVLIFFTGPFLKNPDGEEALARKLVDAQKEASSYKKELGSCLLVFIKVLDFFVDKLKKSIRDNVSGGNDDSTQVGVFWLKYFQ